MNITFSQTELVLGKDGGVLALPYSLLRPLLPFLHYYAITGKTDLPEGVMLVIVGEKGSIRLSSIEGRLHVFCFKATNDNGSSPWPLSKREADNILKAMKQGMKK